MLHVMPDKSVRVTSRFPDGHSTVYFDLEHGNGFTLEQDRCRSDLCILRMLHGYRNLTARYGNAAEAAANFAELTTMLADRHCPSPEGWQDGLDDEAGELDLLALRWAEPGAEHDPEGTVARLGVRK